MTISKIIYRIISVFKIFFFKMIYGKKIKIGSKVHFRKNFNVLIEKYGKLFIGRACFFNHNCSINVLESVRIGDDCIFGENVKIYDHNHIFKYSNKLIKEQGFKTEEITIGNNCWIGSNVVILKGANIGNNVVIGAGCIVAGKIEDNMIMKRNCDYKVEKIIYKE